MSAPGRRAVLGWGGALGATALGATALVGARSRQADDAAVRSPALEPVAWGGEREPFHGEHQAGILTPPQAHAVFLGLDLRPARSTRRDVVALLRMLSDDAARLTSGRPPLGGLEATPIAMPGRLTVTFGFGPGLFDAAGVGERCPPMVRSLPAFTGDALDRRWGQSDLLVQVCGDDLSSLTYARRRLLRDAADFTELRWAQQGFLGARGREAPGTTPRNLMGLRDGSANERDPAAQSEVVWSRDQKSPWLRGGTQLVLRRIRIDLDRWDDLDTTTKEATFGRRLDSGAPLTGTRESEPVQRDAVDAQGFRVLAPHAHAARAQARSPAERMWRRGYDYDDGLLADGTPDAGQLFAAYQRDLATAFVPVQRRLAEADALGDWITHVGSAAYALPPGAREGSWVGEGVLAT